MPIPYSLQGSEQPGVQQVSFFAISEWAASAAPINRTRMKTIVFQGFRFGGGGVGVPQQGL